MFRLHTSSVFAHRFIRNLGASGASAGPGYPFQFLSPFTAGGPPIAGLRDFHKNNRSGGYSYPLRVLRGNLSFTSITRRS
jgi:hypothetical protein